ncbi:hypothetical protein [Oceaniglobus trochenteri]|uniref:hypothetical protein n=1 Tax=Oceaniglobus trochenteri TaxID=2763260 RepID=UPI001CFFD238|nr:hypothetical protein [Oceaniglobus trochenteri]
MSDAKKDYRDDMVADLIAERNHANDCCNAAMAEVSRLRAQRNEAVKTVCGAIAAERDEMRDALERIRLNQSLAECQRIASAALLPAHHDPDYRRYLAQQRGE